MSKITKDKIYIGREDNYVDAVVWKTKLEVYSTKVNALSSD